MNPPFMLKTCEFACDGEEPTGEKENKNEGYQIEHFTSPSCWQGRSSRTPIPESRCRGLFNQSRTSLSW